MEQEIILHGTPEATTDVKYWNAYRASVLTGRHGLAYQIKAGGSMLQDFTAIGVLSKYIISLEYDLLDRDTAFGTKVVMDFKGPTRSQKVYIPLTEFTSKTFNSVSIEGSLLIDEDFEYLSVAIENATSSNLLVYSISCLATVQQEDGVSINTQDFAKYCISYGTDANKPKLR